MRKVKFFIDDLAFFKHEAPGIDFGEQESFKAIYTLYGEGKNIDRYELTDTDGNKIPLSSLNGYQKGLILNDCRAYFTGGSYHSNSSKPCGVIRIDDNGRVSELLSETGDQTKYVPAKWTEYGLKLEKKFADLEDVEVAKGTYDGTWKLEEHIKTVEDAAGWCLLTYNGEDAIAVVNEWIQEGTTKVWGLSVLELRETLEKCFEPEQERTGSLSDLISNAEGKRTDSPRKEQSSHERDR